VTSAQAELRLLALLLDYPDERLLQGRDEVEQVLAQIEPTPRRDALAAFASWLYATDPLALEQEYVASFDFSKRTTLHLSFYTYGDRRQRGMAMLKLKQRFAAAGLPLVEGALPDYLPAVLEFAALAPMGEGDEVLAQLRAGIEVVRAGLHDAGSTYALLLDAIVAGMPALSRQERAALERLAVEGPPTEQVGLEPFAPPEFMPEPVSGGGCGGGGGGRTRGAAFAPPGAAGR
jgi:nitrate reductase molybdenum cofactor assembly chaperone NarJ/NarW